jgi:hypothetical protein
MNASSVADLIERDAPPEGGRQTGGMSWIW